MNWLGIVSSGTFSVSSSEFCCFILTRDCLFSKDWLVFFLQFKTVSFWHLRSNISYVLFVSLIYIRDYLFIIIEFSKSCGLIRRISWKFHYKYFKREKKKKELLKWEKQLLLRNEMNYIVWLILDTHSVLQLWFP